jgi:hypothetical protein
MRRILIVFIPAVLLVGLGLGAVAWAHGGGEHLDYIAKPTSFERADVGERGTQIVINFDVFEHRHAAGARYGAQDDNDGDRAGHGAVTCVTAAAGQGAVCSAAIEVTDGQLSVQGLVHRHGAKHDSDAGAPVTLPVVGGSGRFFAATGEVDITHADGTTMDSDQAGPSGDDRTAFDHRDDRHGDHALHLAFHLKG